ncbi:MAG: UrcA family protein [Hyphomonadaceae bacterium]|nr:UrcA family protein [Hyphomonadaceae bacterium]
MRLRTIALALAGAASSLTLAASPALAYPDDEITVRPYTIERHRVARGEEALTLSRPVAIDDLNLRYDADVMEMERRIHVTARDICRELDRAAFSSSTSDRQCVREAVYDAIPQARSAVARARY